VHGRDDGARPTPQQEVKPQACDRETGKHSQSGVQALRNDGTRGIEGNRSQQVHVRCVRRGDNQAQQESVLRRPPRADKVSGNDRFPVPRLKRVQGTETSGHECREQNNLQSRVTVRHHLRERTLRRALAIRAQRNVLAGG
jgi:hypothetical protein